MESDPDFSVIVFPVTTGPLTVVLTKSACVGDEKLYEEIRKQQKMEVKHVFCAAGKMDIHYPPGISVHMCSMYAANHEKIKALCQFWTACLETAKAGQAVVIHSKTGEYRAPLATAAIMAMAGYPIHHALTEIKNRRQIYPGLLWDWTRWPEWEQTHVLAKPLCQCYEFIRLELTEFMKFANNNLVSQCSNASAGGVKRARSTSPPKKNRNENDSVDDKTNQTVSAQCDENALTAANANYNSMDKRPRNLWECGQCRVISTNLRECWECGKWECRKCSYWCTFCPSSWQEKYTLCSHCYYKNGQLLVRNEKTWCCQWCGAARFSDWYDQWASGY